MSLPATVVAGGGSWQRAARIVNLGLGGACLSISEGIPVGSPVALVVDAPHLWDPLRIDSSIAWTAAASGAQPTYLGVKFHPSSGALLRALVDLLDAAAFG